MKMHELEVMLNEDLKIDENNLDAESIKTPILHAKWLKFSTDEAYKLSILHKRMAKLKRAKWSYYSGRTTGKQHNFERFDYKLAKGEIQIYVDGDDDIQRLDDQIQRQSMLVERLSEVVKSLQFRHTHIKNAIEFRKIMLGIN